MVVRLLLATHNRHKVRELGRLLVPLELEPLPRDFALPPETGETFTENALIKARAAARATDRPAIADDSGIEARALGGAPGVRSARFAGPRATDADNLAKLRELVPPGSPLAYVCVIVHVDPSGAEHVFSARCTGRMSAGARGTNGFGYDPVFLPDDDASGRTMAELSSDEKDAISHRGRAARALLAWMGR